MERSAITEYIKPKTPRPSSVSPGIQTTNLPPFSTKPAATKSDKSKMPSASVPDGAADYTLTAAEKEHFLEHGFVKIPACFTHEQAADFTKGMWTRLGFSPTDKSTWTTERTNMPSHKHVSVKEFAPRAWSAMCQLLGGEERISPDRSVWSDGFIVNHGLPEYKETDDLDYRGLPGWHNDGDFFVHYLDSPEQALLVIPLWSDIVSKAGGTAICTDGIAGIAKHLVSIYIYIPYSFWLGVAVRDKRVDKLQV